MIRNKHFDTHPIVVHAQGPHKIKPYWKPIRDRFFSSPRRKILPTENLTVITWNNGHEAMGMFEKSMDHLGLECMVLGQGVEKWVNSYHKPLLTRDALQNIQTPYVLGIDSRDAIILDDPSIVLQRFLEWFDCGLLISADVINWPNLPKFKKFEERCAEAHNTPYKYINSGVWIGSRDTSLRFFEAAVNTDPVPQLASSEQGITKQVFQDFYPEVQLDYHCKVFQNIGFAPPNSLEISDQ